MHGVNFEEAIECCFSDFQIRRNKSYQDRYQLIGTTLGGRGLTEIAARAVFFAQLHKKSSGEDWLNSIIQERIDFEEAAFTELKQALLS